MSARPSGGLRRSLLGTATVRPGVDPFLRVLVGLAALAFVLTAATRGRLGQPPRIFQIQTSPNVPIAAYTSSEKTREP